jgi:hypothetical protein
MPVQDHIHLQGQDDRPWATDDAPDNTYSVVYPKMRRETRVWVETEEALDGTVHVHQLVDDGGNVVRRDAYRHTLMVTDTELVELLADHGKKCDYVPNMHPDSGESCSGYVEEVLFSSDVKLLEVDPMLKYYYVTIRLEPLG